MQRTSLWISLCLICALALAGCGGGGQTNNMTQSQQSSVFITGGDAPLPSVLAFNVSLNSMKLNGTTEALAQPITVDFARLLGMRTLIGFNSIPAGTYNSVTISLADPSISFLDLTTTPPSATSITGTFKDANGNNTPSTTITVALTQPLTVSAGGMGGLHLDFNLHDSLQTDNTGQITGVVKPVIKVRPLAVGDSDGDIDDLRGGLVSVNVTSNSFVLQRIGGRQI